MSTVNLVGVLTEVFSSLAFVTNSLVAGVLLAQFRTLTPMLLFILNLMFVDGLFALFGAVFRAPGMLIGNFYQMNSVMVWLCPMLPYFIGTVPPLCSIAILLITMDRFIAITKPIQYPCYMNRQKALTLITCSWGLGAVKVLVELLLVSFTSVLSVIYDSSRARCAFTSEEYIFSIQTLGYLVPFLIMTVLYLLMISEILKLLSNRDLGLRQGSKAKMFLTTSLITVAFFITWCPYYVTMVHNVVFKHKQKGFVGTVVMFYLNLLWDPIVYALRTPVVYNMCSKIVRKGFTRLSLGRRRSNDTTGVRKSIVFANKNDRETRINVNEVDITSGETDPSNLEGGDKSNHCDHGDHSNYCNRGDHCDHGDHSNYGNRDNPES